MAISKIPALTGHILFPLWELILGRQCVGRSTTLMKQQFHRLLIYSSYFIPTVRGHIGQTRCGRSNLAVEWQFLRFLLWQVISFLMWEVILGRWGVGRSTPSIKQQFSLIPTLTANISCTLRELIFGRPGVGRFSPSQNGNFWYSYSDSLY